MLPLARGQAGLAWCILLLRWSLANMGTILVAASAPALVSSTEGRNFMAQYSASVIALYPGTLSVARLLALKY